MSYNAWIKVYNTLDVKTVITAADGSETTSIPPKAFATVSGKYQMSLPATVRLISTSEDFDPVGSSFHGRDVQVDVGEENLSLQEAIDGGLLTVGYTGTIVLAEGTLTLVNGVITDYTESE